MSRRRFFVPEIRLGSAEITGLDAEHLVRVLRAEAGQIYEISDNRDIYLAEIETARKSVVSFRVLEQIPPQPPQAAICLATALFKFDRFEWLVEKATELGVSLIQPFAAVRTERGLAAASQKRLARWLKIALESSQQSRRDRLPEIQECIHFKQALRMQGTVRLLLDEDASAPPVFSTLPNVRSANDRIALLLGPEGGWTSTEREQALDAGWQPCSLGPTTLRAETAAVAGLAVIQAAWSTGGASVAVSSERS